MAGIGSVSDAVGEFIVSHGIYLGLIVLVVGTFFYIVGKAT